MRGSLLLIAVVPTNRVPTLAIAGPPKVHRHRALVGATSCPELCKETYRRPVLCRPDCRASGARGGFGTVLASLFGKEPGMKTLRALVFVGTMAIGVELLAEPAALRAESPATGALSTFDTGLDGWTEEFPADIDIFWESTDGNPGGFMRTVDTSGLQARALAPSKYLGDWSTLDNARGIVRVDAKLIDAGGFTVEWAGGIEIAGPGGRLDHLFPVPHTSTWRTFTVSIAEADWQVNEGTWAGVLANVTKMSLLADTTDGYDVNGYDNIYVGPQAGIPAVSEWGLAATALLLLIAGTVALSRRRLALAS